MAHSFLVEKAQSHLEFLCGVQPNRRTGSAGNRAAVEYLAASLQAAGFRVDRSRFEVLDYEDGGSRLTVGEHAFKVHTSPYSLGCEVTAELVAVETLAQLEGVECRGKLLLMKGEICAEQLMPKGFVFYNPEHHQRIISLLEAKMPAGIIAATGRSPEQAGALDPFPLLVDGDFDIPNVFCQEAEGQRLAAHHGQPARLVIDSKRIPSHAANVIAKHGPESADKIVLTAHIDAYEDSPGAFDNASGTVVLLILAELLSNYNGRLQIELAALNGEDHYSAAGQMDYLRRYADEFTQTHLAVNIDGVGYLKGGSAYSFYETSDDITAAARAAFEECETLLEGPPWFTGDHMIFLQSGVPCLAFTAERTLELLATIVHTTDDSPEIIDVARLVDLARGLDTFVRRDEFDLRNR